MTLLVATINVILLLALLGPLFLVAYLLLLTISATFAAGRTALPAVPRHRFLVLIPAHNEATLLPTTLANLQKLDYPTELYAIHVVADNCLDETAALGRAGGAVVHERFHETRIGKGYALQWLLARIWADDLPHEAIVILDADTIVSPNFLRVMDARLADGARAIQAYYAARDPGQSPVVGLRYIALAVLHYLRPLGRGVLGGSAGLKGNGMVFDADLMRAHEWTAHLTEDIEFHMSLLATGERVHFAPDAVVWAEMPATLAGAASQNERWERGRVEMLRRYVPRLFRQTGRGLRQGDWRGAYLAFDAAMEHLIPPFSLLFGLTIGLAAVTALNLALQAWLAPAGLPMAALLFGLSLAALLGQLIYVLAGLRLAEAPASVYRALWHVPVFIFWKVALLGRVLTGRQRSGWIRTARNEE